MWLGVSEDLLQCVGRKRNFTAFACTFSDSGKVSAHLRAEEAQRVALLRGHARGDGHGQRQAHRVRGHREPDARIPGPGAALWIVLVAFPK